MPLPTTGVLFSGSEPEPDPGNQLCTPKTDNGQPAQIVSFQPKIATTDLAGVGRPDGVTLEVDENGVWSAIPFGGSGGGGTGGGTSASGGQYVCVVPTPDPADGTGTQFILPTPVLAGTAYWLVRNDAMQRQLGAKAYFSVQGTQLTLVSPLQIGDYIEFYYIQGTPNSETGGGGSVTPASNPVLRGTNVTTYPGNTVMTVTLPAGSAVGDLAIVYSYAGIGGSGSSMVSGWTSLFTNIGTTWQGGAYSKVLDSGDIAAGLVTVTQPGGVSNSGPGFVAVAVIFAGTFAGVREADFNPAGSSSPTLSTTSAVQSGDLALLFLSLGNSGPGTLAVSPGATLQNVNSNGSKVLVADNAPSAGVNTFTVSHGVDLSNAAIVIH